VGVLVVCRIALAALLILGPVFIVLALFESTRGFFEGWLKGVVTFALVPLLTVVMGSGALVAILPMVDGLAESGQVSLRTAIGILVASVVYLSLMLLVMELARTLSRGFRSPRHLGNAVSAPVLAPTVALASAVPPSTSAGSYGRGDTETRAANDRIQSVIASLSATAGAMPASAHAYMIGERQAKPAMLPAIIHPPTDERRGFSCSITAPRRPQIRPFHSHRSLYREKRS
jgi:type IV secretion system protein VirB6